jgi:hypothetical protein
MHGKIELSLSLVSWCPVVTNKFHEENQLKSEKRMSTEIEFKVAMGNRQLSSQMFCGVRTFK